jgi:hypothetical protein
VPAGTHLTQHYGDLTITKAGATYDSLDIHGFVYVKAPNVTIKRSIVRGGVASGNLGLVNDVTDGATNFVIEDSELVPEYPSVWLDAIKGWNYTARRIDAHGTVDTAKVYGDNVTIEQSWLHDTQYYNSDPNQGGGHTHNDGVQVLGGQNIRIIGNTIERNYNAGLQVTQTREPVSGLYFEGNWADGGGCTVNLSSDPLSSMSGVTVDDNRFGRDTRIDNCAIISGQETRLTAQHNVWDDTGAAVSVTKGA